MIDRRGFLGCGMGLGLGLGGSLQELLFLKARCHEETTAPKGGIDLEELFRKYPTIPVMRESARIYLRRLTRLSRQGRPLTGSYYWVPIPRGCRRIQSAHPMKDANGVNWTVQEFFSCWRPESDHAYVWKHVRDSLRLRWGRPVSDHIESGSLPRGRVCRVKVPSPTGGYWQANTIHHANDCPVGPDGLDLVKGLFNLDPGIPDVFDENLRVVPVQSEALARALGRQFLKGA